MTKIPTTLRMACLLALLVGVASLRAAEAESLAVPNPSMEELDPKNGLPIGWGPLGGATALISDDTVACEGKRSLKVLLRGGMGEGATVVGMFKVPPPRGAGIWRITAHVRTFDLAGGACLTAIPYPLPSESRNSETIRGTHDWQKLTLDFPTRPADTSLQVRLIVYGALGQVWWDQVEAAFVEGKP